jgi:HlyD family secretion protein
VNGTVLAKYAEQNEITGSGKPLYKIADLTVLYLRAYVAGDQLDDIKIGQKVKVLIDKDKDSFHTYDGEITWISGKSEFTPKIVQTKEERVNLVYAIKVKVANDGKIKIGMPGEVKF